MELRQLEYFVAVVEEGSFTRAAQRERVAQPAVSAQLQRLERRVGQPLFDRSRRVVRLTQAGWAMLPHARAALAAVRDARTAVDDVAQLVRGTLAVGTVTSHGVDTARLLSDFHRNHPGVEITSRSDNSNVLIEELRDGRLDVAIISIGVDERPDGLDFAVITDEAINAGVAAGHPWSRRTSVPVTLLCEQPLISLPRGTGLRSALDFACAAAGSSPRIAFEADSPVALAELAEHGLGVAVLPESLVRHRPGLHALRIVPELRGRLVWAWRRDSASPAARGFRDLALARAC